jgi:polyisoprenoid-binding protein YceI
MNLNRSILITLTFGLAAAISPAASAQAETWRFDPLHSSAEFTVRHMMISKVHGVFGGVKGTVVYDPKNPAASSVEATIDVTTLNTGQAKRDSYLK